MFLLFGIFFIIDVLEVICVVEEIGYFVMLKSIVGGGGIGMCVC